MKSFEMIIHYDRIGDSDMYNCHEVGELVRCKDCKHRSITYCNKWGDMFEHWEEAYAIPLDGFCSFGERREDG